MTNKERAELGEIIIAHARGLFGDVHAEFDVLITDILANLMHACDQGDQMPSFDNCLQVASMHHDAELEEARSISRTSFARSRSIARTTGIRRSSSCQ
jgi:hypothetical protein